MPLSLKRRWRRAAVAAVLVAPLVLILTVAWAAGTSLSAPARRSVGALPADLRGRGVEFESASGAKIRGWLLPGERGAGAVVLMHGVRGSRLNMLGRARFLSNAGYTVLLFDFQAHGESEGSRITTGYLESRDARAALDFVRAVAPGERVGVLGVSMGGAAGPKEFWVVEGARHQDLHALKGREYEERVLDSFDKHLRR